MYFYIRKLGRDLYGEPPFFSFIIYIFADAYSIEGQKTVKNSNVYKGSFMAELWPSPKKIC